jgi:4a-hydroxytetrahydrobiopterin dehydratase
MTTKVEKVNGASIQSWVKSHKGWARKSNALMKEFHFSSFRDSIVFVNRVATLADEANHHPDIDVRYDRVTLTLSTHSAGGITEKDLKLAEQVDFATSAG